METPQHIAIIIDGNRRFAKKCLVEPWKGHEYGAKTVEDLLEYSREIGITQLTLYSLSTENIKKRLKKELDFLFNICRNEFKKLKEKLKTEKIKVKFIGNLDLLPKDLKNQCIELEEMTKNNSKFTVNFALAYGGREEITHAIKNIIKKKIPLKKIDEKIIEENLYMKDEPDLIIRTGGVKRTSNFLPWQSAYSELIFLDKMWPKFTKEDLISCINEFKSRKRNFGK